ncbi:MarR family transcriptional regulator [uncultured Thiothrix sp.]|uniref:MarR family winged helix-turn-helix transcriptional regulator n=1 Tax=uncultured Thiothrix sp. TaxID=223185 RepID=UPI00262324B4|nr:MarR family transcriptional regulator [uncultured Thiothrix sp.]
MKKPEPLEDSPFKYEQADDSAGFLLWKITTLWQGKLAKVLGDFGITQTQYAILASLAWFEAKAERITQTQLVAHTKIDKMTLSKAIRRLEESGLVVRNDSALDSRAFNVGFSDQGKLLIQQAIVAIENADEEFFSCLSEQQLQTYKALTATVILSNRLSDRD